jgi:hypothetical protein
MVGPSFASGSKIFDLVNARIMDNYNQGDLICTGSTLSDEINCVGFDNGSGDQVFYVTIPAGGKNLSYTMLKGPPGPEAGKAWPCTVQ